MHDINTFLPFWEGFSVTAIRPDGDDLLIDLIPQPTRLPTCSGCHQPSTAIHEYCQRSIRDLSILGRAVRLNVELRRIGCSTCGKKMELVRWLDRHGIGRRRTIGIVAIMCGQFFSDLMQPFVDLGLRAGIGRGERPDDPRLALRDDQLRTRYDEERRADDRQAQLVEGGG